jgi:hypothetical protein
MTVEGVTYRRNSDVLFRNVHGVVLLLDPCDGEVVALGGAGPDLWDLLATPITVGDAVHRLATAYQVPAETITSDVRAVFERLAHHHVLQAAG